MICGYSDICNYGSNGIFRKDWNNLSINVSESRDIDEFTYLINYHNIS